VWALARRGDPAYEGRCLAFLEDAYERANQMGGIQRGWGHVPRTWGLGGP